MAETPHRYQIFIRQSDLLIELASDDVYFISKQMNQWFTVLLDERYVPAVIPAAPRRPAPQPSTPSVSVAPPPPEPAPQPLVTLPTLPVQEAAVLAEPIAPMPARRAPAVAVAPPEDDFEAVLTTLMEDMEGGSSGSNATLGRPNTGLRPISGFAGAEEKTKSSLGLIDSLSDLFEKAGAHTPEHSLLLSAYYLTYFEAEEKFSLKRVNSLMVKSGLTPVNHSVLETTLSQGYLEMVPDLTGMADVTEYSLTVVGRTATEKIL